MEEDRLRKLARGLDALAEKDELSIRWEHQMAELRCEAAFELYAICSNFVRSVNALSTKVKLELAPESYSRRSFRDSGPNLFQINASGRIVQVAFETTEPMVTTENFRISYTLEGAVRWFSQQTLESLGVRENLLFYCVEEGKTGWICFDPQTHRRVPFDEDYLAGLFEELLK